MQKMNKHVSASRSMDIVVNVTPVKIAHAAQMPDRQFRFSGMGQHCAFNYEALQQFADRYPLPLSLSRKARLNLS
jgi:hypothetical protein